MLNISAIIEIYTDAKARWFYSLYSDMTIVEASAGLGDAISLRKSPSMVNMFNCDVTGGEYESYPTSNL